MISELQVKGQIVQCVYGQGNVPLPGKNMNKDTEALIQIFTIFHEPGSMLMPGDTATYRTDMELTRLHGAYMPSWSLHSGNREKTQISNHSTNKMRTSYNKYLKGNKQGV